MSDHTKETFFSTLKELENQHTSCSNKAKFIENVLSGKETVSFSVIDRCRETALQLRQCHYIFSVQYKSIKNNPLFEENATRLEQLSHDTESIVSSAVSGLETVLSWTPNAVNTRASGGQRTA